MGLLTTRFSTAALLFGGLLFAPFQPSAHAASGDPAGFAPLGGGGTKQVQIRDPNMNNMVAYTLTIPASWNFQGTVLLNPSCGANGPWVVYRAWSDDLRYGIQRMPAIYWFTPSDPRIPIGKGCVTMDAMSAMEVGGMVVPTIRPNARLVSTTEAPEAAGLASAAAQLPRIGMNGAATKSDAKRLKIEYMVGKQAEEETLDIQETVADDPTITIVSRPGQRMQTQSLILRRSTAWVIAERAPKGQLDAAGADMEQIRKSLTVNPDWDRQMAEMIRQRGTKAIQDSWTAFGANLKANQASYNKRLEAGNDFIVGMQKAGEKRNADFAAYEDSRSRHTADQVDAILDRQYYVNPSNGQTSTISTTYTNNWQRDNGDMILSNIWGLDPNGTVAGNWTQVVPIKH